MDGSSFLTGSTPSSTISHLSKGIEDMNGTSVGSAMLISAGYDQCIKFWDIARGEARENFTHKDSQINTMSISPDGLLLAIAGWQHLRIYNLGATPPTLATSCDAVSRNITAIGFDERCKWFYTGGEDASVKIWDFRSNLNCRRIFQVNSAVNCVVTHPNQVTLIVTDISGALYLWDLRRDACETFPNLNLDIFEHITCVDISRTADTLVGVTNKGKVIVWAISTSSDRPAASFDDLKLQETSKVVAHSKYALKCHFSPDCKYFATTGADGYVHLWNTADTTKPTKSFYVASDFTKPTHPDKVESRWVWDCAFTSDSKYLFTASGSQLKLWNLETVELVRQYQGHNKMITCFTFREFPRLL